MAVLNAASVERIRSRLQFLYDSNVETTLERLCELVEEYSKKLPQGRETRWDERDIVLITYGDQVHDGDTKTLSVLHRFLQHFDLAAEINTVHILPFCPYSSDDGFSVIDYRAINPELGDWKNVGELGNDVDLMFDLVLNHCSQHSSWFQSYVAAEPPHDRFFIDVDPSTDLSEVTRPRSLPLLTEFETANGPRHVWTTFSADQVDLNFCEPDVLLEMLDILLLYVEQGARIIRLDAIAYLWKRIGTNCIHLPETHEVVKLYRDVLDIVAPHVILLTETNVPHDENISYFGDGDEAHMVYQFSLPPLLLDAFLSEDASSLKQWLAQLQPAPANATFFNFTASHDGIGVRPLEGLVPQQRIMDLATSVKARGGRVGTKRNSDGTDTPYELNVTYVDALRDTPDTPPEAHARRFLATQAIMLAMRGVPGVYFHSLTGSPNDLAGVEESGIPRRINRHKYDFNDLLHKLSDRNSTQAIIFHGYRKLLSTRIKQPAFHPDGDQQSCEFDDPQILGFRRRSPDGNQEILVVANISNGEKIMHVETAASEALLTDLLSDTTVDSDGSLRLGASQVAWLTRDGSRD